MSVEMTQVVLSPYVETPQYFRTTARVEGAKRWFEKSRVKVVSRDTDRIVLSMPRTYADARAGISSLVLEDDVGGPGRQAESAGGCAESPAQYESLLPERLDIQVGPAGRIVIPAVFRDAMRVKEGDRLMARVEDGELRLISPMMGVRKAQKLVRDLIPGDDSLADALIVERREEARREVEDG